MDRPLPTLPPLGRDVCGLLSQAEQREWLVTNGIGGYACGTVAGLLTRHYHGLLVAALKPPLERTLLLTKVDETVHYGGKAFPLHGDRWSDGSVKPQGYLHLERFTLEGTCPVWRFALGDALLEKRLWMEPGANITYVQYIYKRGSEPFGLALKVLVNYRDHHDNTQGKDWQMQITPTSQGVRILAFPEAQPFFVQSEGLTCTPAHTWYEGYTLAVERYRGIFPYDDHLHAATFTANLEVGQSMTLVASTTSHPALDGSVAYQRRQAYEQQILDRWMDARSPWAQQAPDWIAQLVLAADQFIVDRTVANRPGKTVIAGYPWFGDWGRDTMIALPGLTLTTGRTDIARPILRTFAQYLDQGMLPNVFPEVGETPAYNTVDATLWYFEALRIYHRATQDDDLLAELFPALEAVIDWHRRGTRYQIHQDSDGLLYAGEPGVQLTWMDAKVDDWVVTPRIGKPVEVNALWYNALVVMGQFATHLGRSATLYEQMAQQTRQGFQRFWQADGGYCYDVLDGPSGDDASFRPNQIFAVALPFQVGVDLPTLLTSAQQKAVVDKVARRLVTSYGLRSLDPQHSDYQGHYGGDRWQRDGAYHQGPVWGWLIGPFVQAHLQVYGDPALAQSFLEPMADHLRAGCVGSLSEIFDGDAPMQPRGAFAQAWTVAEVLRSWERVYQVATDKG